MMRPTDEMKALLRACASSDGRVSRDANITLASSLQDYLQDSFEGRFDKNPQVASAGRAEALELPIKQGILKGDIISNIYEMVPFEAGQVPEWPLDFVAPGTEADFYAYTMPHTGRIPERHVESDYVMVQTYPIAASIDYSLDYARDARWDIVSRAAEVMDASMVRKLNDDGWHTILGAAYDRNVMVYDSDAQVGQFTKRLVSLMKTQMRRLAGGNSASLNRGKLTDLYLSPEAVEDIRSWGIDLLDEVTRREVWLAPDGSLNRVFQVNLHDIDELGVNQEYQLYFTGVLGGTLASTDTELVVGLDLQRQDSFVMPVRDNWQVFEDMTMHRQWRQGWYGRMRVGFGVLNNLRILAGSF